MKRILSILLLLSMLISLTACSSNKDEADSSTRKSSKKNSDKVALTIGEHTLDQAEMTYYYRYAISTFVQNCGDSIETALALYGVDLTKPLDEQTYYDEDRFWSDYFIDQAIELAVSDYTMADLANAEGYTMSDDEAAALEKEFDLIEGYAHMYGYTETDEYIQAYYGKGCDYDSYQAFMRKNALAESFRQHKTDEWYYAQIAAAMENTLRGNLGAIDVSTPPYDAPQ